MIRPSTVSMRRVALEAGVSVATVSKALSGKRDVSTACRARVLAVCESLGYRLNHSIQDLARSARSGLTRQVAFVLVGRSFTDPAYVPVLSGSLRAAASQGFYLLLESLRGDEGSLYDMPPLLRDGRVDGVILAGRITRPVVSVLLERGLRVCVLGALTDAVVEGTLNVASDVAADVRALFRRLQDAGCRRIGIYQEAPEYHAAQLGLAAYRECAAQAGYGSDGELAYLGTGPYCRASAVLGQLIRADVLPFDGLVASDFRGALELSGLLRARFGFGPVPVTLGTISTIPNYHLDVPHLVIPSRTEEHAALAMDSLIRHVLSRQPLTGTTKMMLS